jgi:hypothetical protein
MSQKKIIIAQFSRDWIGFDIVLRIYAFYGGRTKMTVPVILCRVAKFTVSISVLFFSTRHKMTGTVIFVRPPSKGIYP